MKCTPSPAGEQAEPRYVVGHDMVLKQAIHKGFCVSLEWLINSGHSQPVMAIWPEPNPGDEAKFIWAIGKSAIPGFTKDLKTPTTMCMRESADVLARWMPEAGVEKVRHLADAVAKFSKGFLAIPPTPPGAYA